MYLKTKGPKKRTGKAIDAKTERVGTRSVVYQLEMQLCNKPGCEKLHGPYWSAYWVHNGRQCKRYIGRVWRRPTLDQFRTIEKRNAKAKRRKVTAASSAPSSASLGSRRRLGLEAIGLAAPKATTTSVPAADPRQIDWVEERARQAAAVDATIATMKASVAPSSVGTVRAPHEDEREQAVST